MIAYSRYLPIIQDLYTARQNVRMNDLINDLYVNPIFKFESILLFCIVSAFGITAAAVVGQCTGTGAAAIAARHLEIESSKKDNAHYLH